MRISELSERSDVPVATVKYYLREQLLHPGAAVTARMADYDETHLERLRLLRVLREVGQVPISRLRAVVEAVESRATAHEVLGEAADALAPTPPPPGPGHDEAREHAERLVAAAGWDVRSTSPDMADLTGVMETYLDLTGTQLPEQVARPYVEAADRLARWEIDNLDAEHGGQALLRQMVLGQVLLGRLLMVLRRLAEESYSNRRFGAVPAD